MSGLGKLTVTLELENVKFQSALLKSDYDAQKFAKNFIQNMDKAKNHAKEFAERSTQYLQTIEKAAKNINKNTEWAWWSAAGNEIGKMGGYVTQAAKAYTDIHNKMKLVSDSSAEAATRLTDVFDIAMKTSQSTEAVAGVYQTFAQNAQSLGLAQKDVADLTKTVSNAVAASGASGAAASNALTQFGQSLLIGKMKAQEFNSLITQTPTIIQAMAKGLGMTMAEFKAAVDDGKISSAEMVKGLKNAGGYIDELAGKMGVTLDGAMTNLSTSFTKWVGETDNAWGVSRGFAESINALAQNLNAAAPYALGLGAALGGMQLGKVAEQTWTLINAKRQDVLESQKQAQQILFKSNARAQEIVQELKATQTYIASLQAQMSLARTEQQRAIIATELQLQTQRETALIQQQTVAIKALETAQNQANVAKRMGAGLMTALGGPWGIAMGIISAGAMVLFDWSQKANQAREEALRYADSLDTVKVNIEKMTKAQTDAEMVKLSRSISEQEKALAELKNRQAELNREIEQGATVYEDAFAGTMRIAMSAEELAKKQEELKLVTADVESAQKKLNASYETQNDLQAHIPVAELRSAFEQLFPNIDISAASTDSLTASVNGFTLTIPSAVVEAYKLAGAIGVIQQTAIGAALAVANLAGIAPNGEILSDKAQKYINRLNKQTEISKLKRAGKTDEANKLQAELNLEGQEFTGLDYEKAYEAQLANLKESSIKTGGGGKPKKTKAEKEAEKAAKKQQRDAERSAESYQNQVAEMTNRLAGLKANAADIAVFGQVSDYQEVRKLTEDIAINAEKYKGYGEQGVAKLKELAGQLDSAQQQVAISQFTYNNGEKLKAMEFELKLLGKTRQEQELMQYNNELDLEAARLKIGMSAENVAKLDEEIVRLKARRAEIQAQAEQARGSFKQGMLDGWNNIEADVSNVAGNVANITQNAFDGMADSLTQFVMTGKADFRSFAQSILGDISKMLIKMALFNAIKQGMSFMGYSDGGLVGDSFAVGGYTGDGGKYTPAGIVHKGEYVITKEATARLGLDYLNYLNYGKRGFSGGGGVAVPRVPSISANVGGAMAQQNDVSITINIDNAGNEQSSVQAQAEQGKQLGNLIKAQVLEVLAREKRVGGMLAM